MRTIVVAATLGLALVGCGLPPILNGARFLILSESGTDVAQLDFPDQGSCTAAERADTGGAARCQRTTMWDALPVAALVDLPDRTRIDAHFRSMAHCQRPSALARIGAAVLAPCLQAAPKRGVS